MKFILFISLILFSLFLWGEADDEDYNNKLFLQNLDSNILSTIKITTTFNEIANRMVDIKGVDAYKRFLMDMTIECSNLRSMIRDTDENNAIEREESIKTIIFSIRSDSEYKIREVDDEINQKNRLKLEYFSKDLNQKVATLRKKIIDEEKQIHEHKYISKQYLGYHSHHFLYSLLLDFIQAESYLSMKNREVLTQVVSKIIESL